jgi:hypothetical protein
MKPNPVYTSLKTLTITYKTPQETLLATPVALPTTEPSTPQIRYTVGVADLPNLSFGAPRTWVAIVYGAGKNGVSSVALYWRMKKNGVSVATSSISLSANNYYTVNAYFYDINIGDVLELSLWASASGPNWDYKAYQVQVTRINLFNRLILLKPCNFKTMSIQPVLTLGNPIVYSTYPIRPHHLDKQQELLSNANSYEVLMPGPLYKTYRLTLGDVTANTATVNTHSANRPYYSQQYVPTTIEGRGLLVD